MGFKRNKGCEETAATLWELLSIRKRQGSRTFVGFLDLSNAFPTTWRERRLFAMLGDCRSVCYQIDKARVRMGLHSSEPSWHKYRTPYRLFFSWSLCKNLAAG
jgi:hypothetical protein